MRILIGLLVILLAGSCKKYEDGNYFHGSSKTERLCRKWKIAQYKVGGVDHTAYMDSMYLSFEYKKDGSFQEIMAHSHMYYVIDGSWKLVLKKKYLDMIRPGYESVSWEITKLEEDELWAVQHYDLTDIEYHLVPYQ